MSMIDHFGKIVNGLKPPVILAKLSKLHILVGDCLYTNPIQDGPFMGWPRMRSAKRPPSLKPATHILEK